MPAAGQLAFFAKDTKSYKPLGAALKFRTVKDRVALLWGDPVYVIVIDGGKARVSAKGHHLSGAERTTCELSQTGSQDSRAACGIAPS